jgi:NAD+ synthase (glutamine-hydrolysing)
MFANQIGCDGERLYFDGCSSIACNGEMIVQSRQFSVHEVVRTNLSSF